MPSGSLAATLRPAKPAFRVHWKWLAVAAGTIALTAAATLFAVRGREHALPAKVRIEHLHVRNSVQERQHDPPPVFCAVDRRRNRLDRSSEVVSLGGQENDVIHRTHRFLRHAMHRALPVAVPAFDPQAVAGDRAEAEATRARAREAVAGIADPEDRQLIEQDLESTPL